MSEAVAAIVEGKANKQLYRDVCFARGCSAIMRTVFTKATGLALDTSPEGILASRAPRKENENPFCALLAENPATLAVCLQAHEQMIQHTGDIPHTVTCPFGLTETAVPVKTRGGKSIGYLRIGQVLRRPTDCGRHQKVSQKLEESQACVLRTIPRRLGAPILLIPPEQYGATIAC